MNLCVQKTYNVIFNSWPLSEIPIRGQYVTSVLEWINNHQHHWHPNKCYTKSIHIANIIYTMSNSITVHDVHGVGLWKQFAIIPRKLQNFGSSRSCIISYKLRPRTSNFEDRRILVHWTWSNRMDVNNTQDSSKCLYYLRVVLLSFWRNSM